jgi:hypothetical protein
MRRNRRLNRRAFIAPIGRQHTKVHEALEILIGDLDLKDAHPLALAPPVPQHPRHILPP